MTSIILQARLGSTRLPGKALLPLAGEPILVRVMQTLRTIPADAYVLACDEASFDSFLPLANANGFTCISGSASDVLERFCKVIRQTGTDLILRATGDNPFLFAGAAEAALARYQELRRAAEAAGAGSPAPDYFTWAGLPHGSGVEILKASALLQACEAPPFSAYEHEHVGPALYAHRDQYRCVFEKAPDQWFYPELRTTVDTAADYKRVQLMAKMLLSGGHQLPAPDDAIAAVCREIGKTLLFVPTCASDTGSGHLRRALELISALRDKRDCLLYVPEDLPAALQSLLDTSYTDLITHTFPIHPVIVVLDHFRSPLALVEKAAAAGAVIALDEGGADRERIDFLIDILPGVKSRKTAANISEPAFLPLPRQREGRNGQGTLVVCGGGDSGALALAAARSCLLAGAGPVAVVLPAASQRALTEKDRAELNVLHPIENLREQLHRYRLVVTYYGFTAFEALAAGCQVLLVSPSAYHYRLARDNGFTALSPGALSAGSLRKLLSRRLSSATAISSATVPLSLADQLASFSAAEERPCPLCHGQQRRTVYRGRDRTVSLCLSCRMRYLSFSVNSQRTYQRDYFFNEYRTQYGKTYLEDFEHIRSQGLSRIRHITALYRRVHGRLHSGMNGGSLPRLLDVGCAYGPFLAAASSSAWQVTGTDISADAVEHVRSVLSFPAVVSAFPAPDSADSLARNSFEAITLWYVIEHFSDLEPVLARIRELLVSGGILAFSTPSSSGVSALFSKQSFYRNSPIDHFTLWNPRSVRRQLSRQGFCVKKIVSTGIHPERLPLFGTFLGRCDKKSLLFRTAAAVCRLFSWGDTFEVYAYKHGRIEDVK